MSTDGSRALVALGDPSRLAIVERLARGPSSVTDLAGRLPISRPAVSQHLKVLAGAGLVGYRADGTRRLYYLEPRGIDTVRDYLDRLWPQALSNFAALAERTAPAIPPAISPAIPQAGQKAGEQEL